MTEPMTAWSVLSLPGSVSAAAYLTGQHAKQYRLIVDILAEQRNVTLTGVGFDELAALIRERLPTENARELLDDFPLEARMKQLVEWGTCTSWQDHAETQEEFLRNRYRYQLTEAGSLLNDAVRTLETEFGPGSTAVLLAPAAIVERLNATFTALDNNDAAQASQEFSQLEHTLSAMSSAATEWQSRLAAALGGAPTEAKVTRLLETILAYAEAWGSGIDAWTEAIATHLPRLREVSSTQWRAMALARVGSQASEQVVDDAADGMRAVTDTLAVWFTGSRPQAVHLRRQIRNAVAPVLRGHRALLAVGGTVSRKADLLQLAEAIETLDGDDDAWQLWCTATGLYSARHVDDDAPEISDAAQTSVWDAPPVPISRRLRTQGTRSLSGRAPHIVDRRAARAEARRRALRDQRDQERAARSLSERSGTALSTWSALTAMEAELLLDLIADSRHHVAADGSRTATSADGRWRLRLTPSEGSAVLRIPEGRLVLADGMVEFSA